MSDHFVLNSCCGLTTVDTNQDEHSYPLRQIYFYLTEGCNLKCRHCWIAPKYQAPGQHYPALDLKLFRSIIAEAKPLGLNSVKLTGGEPLLHPEISELLEVIHNERLALVVETNGILCTPELALQLKKASSRTFVSVSIDGADAATHDWLRGVDGAFEAAWQGIRNLVNAGFRPQIIMSLIRRNKGQIEAVVRMAEAAGVGSVKFNLVHPIARGEAMQAANETLNIHELVELGAWVDGTLSKRTSIRLHYSHPMAFRPLSRMFGQNGHCSFCAVLGILGVLADGSYALCGIGENVPELVFGHAGKDQLDQVWHNSPVLKELRSGLPDRLEGVCAECLMKKLCFGSCIAQNYYSTNNLWAPFWFCEEARNAGLFPVSRLKS